MESKKKEPRKKIEITLKVYKGITVIVIIPKDKNTWLFCSHKVVRSWKIGFYCSRTAVIVVADTCNKAKATTVLLLPQAAATAAAAGRPKYFQYFISLLWATNYCRREYFFKNNLLRIENFRYEIQPKERFNWCFLSIFEFMELKRLWTKNDL